MKSFPYFTIALCCSYAIGGLSKSTVDWDINAKVESERRQLPGNDISPYAPTSVRCPNEPLLRSGKSIAPSEQRWVKKRKAKATKAFKRFLKKQGDFPALNEYPTLALANSGGGVRAFLISAGMRLAWDEREGDKYSTSGLLQSLTYESGLSSSAVLLGSYVANNNAKTTELYNSLWKTAFANGLFTPGGPGGSGPAYSGISVDVLAKQATGVPTTASDVTSRLFGYVAFKSDADGPAGVGKIFSASMQSPAYANYEAPIPIMTALNLEDAGVGCGLPPRNSTQFEFTPFEFGSFDKDIRAFTPMEYMGSTLSNGKPSGGLLRSACVKGFDNLNFVIGTSTAINNQFCGFFGGDQAGVLLDKAGLNLVNSVIQPILGTSQIPFFSLIPNFAYKYAKAPKVQAQQNLMLVDGGENIQVVPVWPYLFRRDIKVLFMTDSGTAGRGKGRINFPNGGSLYNTYIEAKSQGVQNRLPKIPDPDAFVKLGLNKRPVFFGCNKSPNDPAMTIIYMPNEKYTFASDVETDKNKFTPEQSLGLLMNGAQVGSAGNDKKFGFCVSCAALKRQAKAEGKSLPDGCRQCFKKYCYN